MTLREYEEEIAKSVLRYYTKIIVKRVVILCILVGIIYLIKS